jgi:hypothetical protein
MKSFVFLGALLAGLGAAVTAAAQISQSYTAITTAPVAPSVTTTRSVTYPAPAPVVNPPASYTVAPSITSNTTSTTTESTAVPSAPITVQESIPDSDEPNAQVLGTATSGNTTILFEAANAQDIHSSRLRTWDEFAQAHPGIATTLAYKPWLINDPGYLNRHPALSQFFARHPEIKTAMIEDSGNFAAIPPRPGE